MGGQAHHSVAPSAPPRAASAGGKQPSAVIHMYLWTIILQGRPRVTRLTQGVAARPRSPCVGPVIQTERRAVGNAAGRNLSIGDRMLGLDNPLHIAFVLVLVLLVFGAKRLPEMGRSLGEGLRGFKESIGGERPHAHLTEAHPGDPAQA